MIPWPLIGTISGGVVVIALFLGWERRAPNPMLPLTFFRHRGFATANAVNFFMFAALFGVTGLISYTLIRGARGVGLCQQSSYCLGAGSHPSERACGNEH